MLELSKSITDKLLQLGFSSEEIPELLNDLTHLIGQGDDYSKDFINQELESLGWGIDTVDEPLLRAITSFMVSIDDAIKATRYS